MKPLPPLKHGGYCMYHQVNILKKSVSLTKCRNVLVWLFEQTVISGLYSSYLIGTETKCLLRCTNYIY
jgi:hypothetical protein